MPQFHKNGHENNYIGQNDEATLSIKLSIFDDKIMEFFNTKILIGDLSGCKIDKISDPKTIAYFPKFLKVPTDKQGICSRERIFRLVIDDGWNLDYHETSLDFKIEYYGTGISSNLNESIAELLEVQKKIKEIDKLIRNSFFRGKLFSKELGII